MSESIIERDLALIDSIKRGEVEAVASLLAAGADPNASDLLDGSSALELAQRQGHGALAELLLRFHAQPPPTNGVVPRPPEERKSPAPAPASARCPVIGEPGWLIPLVDFYREHGYIRRPRRGLPNPGDESWEVRFLVRGKRELEQLQRLLAQADFKQGKPFRRFGYQMQTIPGRSAVERFHALIALRCGQRETS
jgi:hypothetical protein